MKNALLQNLIIHYNSCRLAPTYSLHHSMLAKNRKEV